jgi:hypothetical protein
LDQKLQNKIGKVSFYLLHYSVLLQYKVNMGRRQTTKSKKMSSKARSARAKFTLQKALEEDEECPQERMIISSQGVQNLIELVQNHSNSCKNSISGKRINFGQRGSYIRRAWSAVMAYDKGAFWHKSVFPSENYSKIWEATSSHFLKRRRAKGNQKTKKKAVKSKAVPDLNSYGPESDEGQFSTEELEAAVLRLEKSLLLPPDDIVKLERVTVGQFKNELWKVERRSRLTASNCGRVFTFAAWRENTAILKSLLYPADLSKISHIKNGIDLEPVAKELYESISGKEVKECGLFVYSTKGFLAASPDGLIGEDGILEIKCTTVPPDKIPLRPDNFLIHKNKKDLSSDIMLRRTHKYFFQVIMQMYVSGKMFCDFLVYHKPEESEECTWFLETICRTSYTDELWNQIEEKLAHFYHNEMAPEIVNPRFHSTGKFYIPEYRKKAGEDHLKKRELALNKKKSSAIVEVSVEEEEEEDAFAVMCDSQVMEVEFSEKM